MHTSNLTSPFAANSRSVLVSIIFLSLISTTLAESPDLRRQLDLLELHGFSGSILIETSSGTVSRGMGYANKGAGIEAHPDTLYPVASISKHFTAAAILLLEQEGRLKVSDPLGRFWPDRLAGFRGVTIEQLLSHRSGLPFSCDQPEPPDSRESFLSCLETLSIGDSPGQDYEYSNAGYAVLAALIEQISGQRYTEFLRSRLLQPAGLNESGFLDEPDRWPAQRVAHQYTWEMDFETELRRSIDWNLRGSADLVSTVAELARWRSKQSLVLQPETQAKLAALAAPGSSSAEQRWCLNGTMTLGYNATWCGWKQGQVVILSNQNYGMITPAPTVAAFLGAFLSGRPTPLNWTPVLDAISDLTAWEGKYSLGDNAYLDVRVSRKTLLISGRGQDALNFLLVSDLALGKRLKNLTETTSKFARALESGKFARAARLAGDPNMESGLLTWLGGLQERLGQLQKIDVIGTIPQGTSARSYIELLFERGREARRLRWIDRKLSSLLPASLPPAPVHFVPVAPDRLVGFHLGFPERGPVEIHSIRKTALSTSSSRGNAWFCLGVGPRQTTSNQHVRWNKVPKNSLTAIL